MVHIALPHDLHEVTGAQIVAVVQPLECIKAHRCIFEQVSEGQPCSRS